jgi:hypothetical protein
MQAMKTLLMLLLITMALSRERHLAIDDRGNQVVGPGNQWDGKNNSIHGAENNIKGDTNQINGNNNKVEGNNNVVGSVSASELLALQQKMA